MIHEMKIDISECDDILRNKKTFVVRRYNEEYQVGDQIKFIPVDKYLRHIDHPLKDKEYEIAYISTEDGIQEGFCVLSIREHLLPTRDLIEQILDGEI